MKRTFMMVDVDGANVPLSFSCIVKEEMCEYVYIVHVCVVFVSTCVHVVCVCSGAFVIPRTFTAVIISKQVPGSVMAVLVIMTVACIVFVCRGYVCTSLHVHVHSVSTYVRTYCRVCIYLCISFVYTAAPANRRTSSQEHIFYTAGT